MNVQITDYSSNGFIDRTERYQNGTTVQVRGNQYNNGDFNAQVTTERSDGYRLVEQVSGTVYNDGVSNLQRRTISEQLPYALTPNSGYDGGYRYEGYDYNRTVNGTSNLINERSFRRNL